MRFTIVLPAVLGALLLTGCNDLGVGDLNNPGVQSLESSPTRSGVLTLATGLQIGSRFGVGQQNGYNALLGILGREIYNFDPADPRFISEMVVGPLDGGSPAFGGNLYRTSYANIRTANILFHAMDSLTTDPQAGMTDVEREATTGYAQTLIAYEFLRIINTRDDLGAPTDVDIDPTGPPAPIKTRAEVFTHIVNLLDSAKTHLQAGGASFPFAMSQGFAGFDTPPTFLQFNRALRARVAVYQGDFSGALAALTESFVVNDATKLSLGVYHTFTTTAGDSINNLYDPNTRALVVVTALRTDAQLQVDGVTRDKRFVTKTVQLATAKTAQGLSSDLGVNVYQSNSDGVPIIRNEELILLRAEANIGVNTSASLASALTDLNFIRQNSGNLPLYAGPITHDALLNELLYNKRYSLLFEGGHRWLDLRRYDRLESDIPAENTTAGTGHRIHRFPFPTNECLSRNPQPAQGCSPEAGD